MTLTARPAAECDSASEVVYDVFVSYSHAADLLLAPTLQRLVRRVGRPWYSRATLRVFRDTTNLPMSESLWGSIREALDRSATFVLLASPGAAASPWVDREVQFWRQHRDRNSLVIVLTGGELGWDVEAGDFASSSTAVPPALRGWYDDEPAWLDLRPPDGVTARRGQRNDRIRDAARTIAAPLYGIEKDQLEGEDERESRRARRTLAGGVAALALLTVLAVIGAIVAVGQAREAREQARIALSGQLAAVSTATLGQAVDVAGLLAVQAFRTDPNARSRAALLAATTAAGQLVRYVPLPAAVRDVATSKDGRVVVAGLEDGSVWRWRTSLRTPELVASLHEPIMSVGVDAAGDVVAAMSATGFVVSRPDQQPMINEDPSRDNRGRVALSDSGRTLLVTLTDAQGVWVNVMDVPSGIVRHVGRTAGSDVGLAVTTDEEATVLDSVSGSWERHRLSDWSLVAGGAAGFKNTIRDAQLAAGGGSFIYADDSADALVWPTDRATDPGTAPFSLRAPIGNPQAVALSADGTIGAVADSGVVYVGPIAAADQPRAAATALVGDGALDAGSVRFLGADQIVASSGSRLVQWDLTATDRLARTAAVPLDAGCHACGPPRVQVAPGGSQAFLVDGSGFSGEFVDLPALTVRGERIVFGEALYQGSSWTRQGERLVVLVSGELPTHSLPGPMTFVHVDRRVLATGTGPGDSDVVAVMNDGQVLRIDAATGRSTELAPALPATLQSASTNVPLASVGSTGLAAFAQDRVVTVVDPVTRTSTSRVVSHPVNAVTVAGRRVLVRTTDNELEVWDPSSPTPLRAIRVPASDLWAPVSDAAGDVIAQAQSDSTVQLIDVDTGTSLVTFRAAASSGLRAGIGFSPDGGTVVTATEAGGYGVAGDGVVASRTIAPDQLVQTACATAGRDLTVTEWSQAVDAPAPASLTC